MASSGSSTSGGSGMRRQATPSGGVSLAKKRRAAAAAKSTRICLERVLGLTCHSSNSLAVCDSYIAYPAGCVAVLQDTKKKNKQAHVFNKKPISCLCFSPDGKYLATGEYGHEPCARVWELKGGGHLNSCCALSAHAFGIQCVAFSKSQKYLVTVGYRHDRQIIVWNWKAGVQLLYGKFGQPVNSLAFSEDHSCRSGSNYFVTAHNRRIQYWYYDPPNKDGNKKNIPTTAAVLKARSAILGDLQENDFVDVVCGSGPLITNTYALTKSGKLCLFDNRRVLEKFTGVKAYPACSLAMNDSYLFCGCADGIIRLFDPYSLDYIITLPCPHPLGTDVAAPVVASESQVLYADAIAMVINTNKLSVVYNDHSLYVWDVSNVKEVGKIRSFLFHSACVWDITTYPYVEDDSRQLLPESSFVTSSSDNTVRFWCLEPATDQWNMRNIYSKELIRIIYNDKSDYSMLKDPNTLPGDASAVADSSRGVRSISIHANGQHLALGDREGNLRIFDLQFMDKIYEEVAHDSEILSLSYSRELNGVQYLATASRDRMIHVFSSVEGQYQPIQSIPDHSAAVTAVGFTWTGDRLQLLSAGADKSIVFHGMGKDEEGATIFDRFHHIASKSSIYDMTIDTQEKFFLTAGQDKFLRMYGVTTGKKHTVIKAPTTDDSSIIKVTLDPSGLYAATSIADKSVLLFDIYTGECIARLTGHSEVVTQLKFSRNCKYLYSVSGDSCIFVWRLWPELIKTMHERLEEMNCPIPSGATPGPTDNVDMGLSPDMLALDDQEASMALSAPPPNSSMVLMEEEGEQPDFEFQLSMLPVWAQKAALSRPSVAQQAATTQSSSSSSLGGTIPAVGSKVAEGKWAERIAESQMKFALDTTLERPRESELTATAENPESVLSSEGDMKKLRGEELTKGQAATDSQLSFVSVPEGPVEEECKLPLPEEEIDVELPKTSSPPRTPKNLPSSEQESPIQDSPDMETPPKMSSGESDLEPEVVYTISSTHHLDVDPGTFSVTTPTRPVFADEEDEPDVTPTITPNPSPPLPSGVPEEMRFVQANYQSLEKVADEVEEPTRKPFTRTRLSMSARYLRKRGESLRSSGSPELADDHERPIRREGGIPPKCGSSPPALTSSPDVVVEPSSPHVLHPSSASSIQNPSTLSSTQDPLAPAKQEGSDKTTSQDEENGARSSFDVAVSETRKRLQNLGYNIYSKDKPHSTREREGVATKPAASESTMAAGSSQASNIAPSENQGHSGVILKVKEIGSRGRGEEGIIRPPQSSACGASYDPSALATATAAAVELAEPRTLASRTASVLADLEANFRTLAILNAEALKVNDATTIGLISKGVASHKTKVVSMSNRNKKLWRKKAKGGGGASPATTGISDDLISLASLQTTEGEERKLKPTLDTKDIEKASELLDQLKGLFTQ